jgi:hypothetical protein
VSAGKSSYNALRVEFEKKFRTWGARVNYTLSSYKSNQYENNTRINDEESAIFNSTDLSEDDLPNGVIDSTHWFNINGLYRFPSPEGSASWLLGGWSASVSTIMRSGFPLTVKQSTNNLGTAFGFDHQRPNLVGDPSVSGGASDNFEQFINPAAFENAQAFTFGNTPQTLTDQRTPALLNWDVSFDKTTDIGSGQQILLRFEFINFFGQPNLNGQRSVFGQSNFGAIDGVGGFPRTFQFMVKYIF